ncbi:MAG: ATP-binding protein [Syntrophorhabdaceae bacterium]|nr:ATP-binding protein [Syntrophorhabdaceae bacterium]
MTKPSNYQWDFYERAVKNYSVILRLLSIVDNKKNLLDEAPAVFVEELPFEVCKISIEGEEKKFSGFFSIDGSSDNIDVEVIKHAYPDAFSPFILSNYFNYSILYIYPLIYNETARLGYIILGTGQKQAMAESFLRELRMLCNIFNKLLFIDPLLSHSNGKYSDIMVYKKSLDLFPEPVFLIDNMGYIHYVNKKAVDEFSIENRFLIGERFNNIFDVSGYVFESLSPVEGRVEYHTGDNYKIFKLKCYPLEQEDHGRGGIRCIILNDTSQEKIEDEYDNQLKKMESLSLLAGGLAHDFNNLLTGIVGYTSLMKNFLKEEGRLFKYTLAIENAAQRATKLTHNLLNLSKRGTRRDSIVDVNAIIEDLVFILKESYRDMEVKLNLSDMLPPIKGDETDIQSALLNILVNAKDAMDGKGVISVSTGIKFLKNKKGFVVIEIEDNGPGMTKDIIKKAFEPYFTTKKRDNRLGMGLYIAKKVISSHGGAIEIESKPQEGTRFTIYLPLLYTSKTGDIDSNKKEEEDLSLKPGLNIIVVDDEEFIRDFLKGVLKAAGAHVLEAKDGYEAVDIFKNSRDKIDLIILDMIMPGKKGDEVLKEIRLIDEDVKIIISSGFMNERQKQSLKGHHINGFLDKPYTGKALINIIKKTCPEN